MSWMLWLAGATTVLILAYLIYALLDAEHLE